MKNRINLDYRSGQFKRKNFFFLRAIRDVFISFSIVAKIYQIASCIIHKVFLTLRDISAEMTAKLEILPSS